jgi:hypothetical protein
MIGDFLQAPLQNGDLAADGAAVGLELRLARPSQPDAAPDARQVGPHARQAWQQVLELRQLHLHLRLGGARARRKDVENDLGAVHHAHRQRLLQVGPLRRRQGLVEQHQARAGLLKQALELLDLALPDEEVGSGGFDALVGAAHDACARRVRQPAELLKVLVHLSGVLRAFAGCADQKHPFDRGLDVDQLSNKALGTSVAWNIRDNREASARPGR